MRVRRPIARFVLLAVLVFSALSLSWPWIGSTYGSLFRSTAGFVFRQYGGVGEFRFRPLAVSRKDADTQVAFLNYARAMEGTVEISSRHLGFVMTVQVLALVLATPIPIRRRLWAMVCSLIVVNFVIGFRIVVGLAGWFCGESAWALWNPTPFQWEILVGMFHVVLESMAFQYVVPIFIWILVTFRREDAGAIASSWSGSDAKRRLGWPRAARPLRSMRRARRKLRLHP